MRRALPAPGAPPGLARRRADVQWLRVAGMLVVFAIHAAEPFNPWDVWHIVAPARSKWLGELAFLPAPWIMPLFMILAGESAWYALERRSPRAFARERLVRIGLPLVAGMLVLVPPQVWLERRLRGEFSGSLLAFYPHYLEGVYPSGNLSWHHLWFLLFLLVFSLAALPLFVGLRTPAGRRLMARATAPCAGRAGLAWLLLPFAAIRIAVGALVPGVPALAFDWSNRVLLLPVFVLGFVLAGAPGVRRGVDRHWRWALLLALAASGALCAWAWPGYVLGRLPNPRSVAGAALWGGYAATAAAWIVALLGGARRHLARDSEALERASEMAYPFYVLHHGVIVAVAYLAVGWRAPVAAQFAAVVGVSLGVTVALCAAVEATPWLRVLFGLHAVRRPFAGRAG